MYRTCKLYGRPPWRRRRRLNALLCIRLPSLTTCLSESRNSKHAVGMQNSRGESIARNANTAAAPPVPVPNPPLYRPFSPPLPPPNTAQRSNNTRISASMQDMNIQTQTHGSRIIRNMAQRPCATTLLAMRMTLSFVGQNECSKNSGLQRPCASGEDQHDQILLPTILENAFPPWCLRFGAESSFVRSIRTDKIGGGVL